ncbi:hypothetical protein [Gemmata sp.]|uniref:hypothetical protein n=1 Tax=Gemmata sp. TaxID=1914242 RepID=UPI003F72AB72
MRAFSLIFLIVVVAVLGALAYENNYPTTISAWQWSGSVPFPLVVGVTYLLGMLTGSLLVSAVRRSWYRVSEMNRAA